MIKAFLYNLFVIFRYRYKVIEKNLNHTISSDPKETKALINSFYKYLARLIYENLFIRITPKLSFNNLSFLKEDLQNNNGHLLLASHYGNWEMACTYLPTQLQGIKVYGVYRPIKNKFIDLRIKKQRSRHGLILIPMKSIARTIAKNHSENVASVYILIADQNPGSSKKMVWAEFLGVSTPFVNGPKKLLERYKYNASYMKVTPNYSTFNYSIDIKKLSIDPNHVMQDYAKQLEEQIKSKPAYWLWSHKRWKRVF